MSITGAAALGLLIDAAMGGIAVAGAFAEFREGRDPAETPEQAAAEFVKEMVAQLKGEADADAAIDDWMAKHGGGAQAPQGQQEGPDREPDPG